VLSRTHGLTVRPPPFPSRASQIIKCGFAGDHFPRASFPTVTGRPAYAATGEDEPPLVGSGCFKQRQGLQLRCPASHGVMQDWGEMVHVWRHAFKEQLGLASTSDCKVILTEPPLNSASNRERLLQTMFETFGFQAAYVQNQAVLTLYAQGLLTGLVLDAGHGATHAVPIVDGFNHPHLTKRLALSGQHITAHLLDLISRSGYCLNAATDSHTVQQMKESICYVAVDYQRELQLARETTVVSKSFTLPDGHIIKVGAERFMACEALFRPSLADVEGPGIAELIFNCVQEMDMDNRRKMYQHIVLSGGTTMFPGLPTRLEKEMRRLYLQHTLKGNSEGMRNFKLKVEDPPHRRHTVFTGAAVLAEIMRDSAEFWVTKAEFEEDPHRAAQRCGNHSSAR